MRKRLLLASLVSGLLAACSATNGPGDLIDAPAHDDAAETSGAGVGPTLAPIDIPSAGATAAPPRRSGQTAPRRASGRPVELPKAVAVSKEAVKIGIHHLAGNFDAINATFGAKNNDPGNPRRQAELVIKHVNASGGMARRKVEAVYHGTDVTVGTFDEQTAATCAAFTEDAKVFAVVSEANGNRSLERCLAKKDVPSVIATLTISDDKDFAALDRYLYQPTMVSASRLGSFVDLLAANRYFTTGAVLGIMRYSDATSDRMANDVIKPALKKRKLVVTEEVEVTPIQGARDLGAQSAAVGNAILRMRSRGVTHVLFLPTGGQLPFFYLPAAESQGYRPRYAFTSLDPMQVVFGSSPHAQFGGFVGMGWAPGADVALAQNTFRSPMKALCRSIMAKGGADPNKGMAMCTEILFLKSALDKAPAVTPVGLQRGVESLGSALGSAGNWSTFFGPGRHDGVAQARAVVYEQACDCLKHTGPLRGIR